MAARARARAKPVTTSAQQTRERLLAAGRKAFADKGLGGASLREDILAPAGVSVGSFYHQFADKADLLVEILRCDGEQVLKALGASGVSQASEPVPRGKELMNHFFERADRNPYFVKIFVREYYSDSPAVRRQVRKHRDRTTALLRSYYQELREQTGLPLDVDGVATLVANQSFALINYYVEFSKKKRKALRERLVTNMIQLFVGGVLAVRERDEPSTAPEVQAAFPTRRG